MDPVLPQSYATADGISIKDTKSFGVGVDLDLDLGNGWLAAVRWLFGGIDSKPALWADILFSHYE